MVRAATDGPAGIYNVAGDGKLTVTQIAGRLGKPVFTIGPRALGIALRVGHALRLTVHGPEQVRFLQYRPVLANERLKKVFGYTPTKASAPAFDQPRASPLVTGDLTENVPSHRDRGVEHTVSARRHGLDVSAARNGATGYASSKPSAMISMSSSRSSTVKKVAAAALSWNASMSARS